MKHDEPVMKALIEAMGEVLSAFMGYGEGESGPLRDRRLHSLNMLHERKVAFSLAAAEEPTRRGDRVLRLQAAIEGECDGLAIDLQHAQAILEYVDGKGEEPPHLLGRVRMVGGLGAHRRVMASIDEQDKLGQDMLSSLFKWLPPGSFELYVTARAIAEKDAPADQEPKP